jgi:hypothetical protein
VAAARPAPGHRRLLLLIALLAQLAVLTGPAGIPVVRGQGPDPIEAYFEAVAAATGQHVERTGQTVTLTDAKGDPDGGSDRPETDIIEAGYAKMPEAPPPGISRPGCRAAIR